MNVTTEEYKRLIQAKCQMPENRFGRAFFEEHVLYVEKYAHQLAQRLGADTDVVLAAAYLHDIAAVTDFSSLVQHAALGSEMSLGILDDGHFPKEKIKAVSQCIALHSAPLAIGAGPSEAVCLSNADAMSQIANPVYWLFYAYSVREFGFEEGRDWYRERVTSHWTSLIEPAKRIIEPEYQRALGMLEPRR